MKLVMIMSFNGTLRVVGDAQEIKRAPQIRSGGPHTNSDNTIRFSFSQELVDSMLNANPVDIVTAVLDELLDSLPEEGEFSIDEILLKLRSSSAKAIQAVRARDGLTPKKPVPVIAPVHVARIAMHSFPVARIALNGNVTNRKEMVLGLYQSSGEAEGIYDVQPAVIDEMLLKVSSALSKKEISEAKMILGAEALILSRTSSPNLIPVKNGIFDRETNELRPFDPDFVFLSKLPVPYVAEARNPTFKLADGSEWDFDSWLNDLFNDDEGLVKLMWEIFSAVIRPTESWEKMIWFYDEHGNSGKSTVLRLLGALVDPRNTVSMSIDSFSSRYLPPSLVSASLILGDENNVTGFIKEAGNLKAIVTGDPIRLEPKGQDAYDAKIQAVVVQAVNELPRVADKSGSFMRRVALVPFLRNFSGVARPEIKKKFMISDEVTQYVLARAIRMEHTVLSSPAAAVNLLSDFDLNNNPPKRFAEEMLPELSRAIAPQGWVYDLYRAWSKREGLATAFSSQTFWKVVSDYVAAGHVDGLCVVDSNTQIRIPAAYVKQVEPLTFDYQLEDWYSGFMEGQRMSNRHAARNNNQNFLECSALPDRKIFSRGLIIKASALDPLAIENLPSRRLTKEQFRGALLDVNPVGLKKSSDEVDQVDEEISSDESKEFYNPWANIQFNNC